MTAALPGRRPPRRLRTQLTAVVVLTALALALALGLVSTLALRSSLLERIDAQLVAASDRGRDVLPSGGTPVPLPTPDAAGPAGDGPAGDDPAAGDPAAGDQGDGPTPNGFPGTGIPPGLAVRGQAAGTVVVEVRGGEVVDAGYLDETGAVVELTAAQADALLAATAQPGWVDVPGLGRYRAVAAERPTRPAGGADDAGSTGDVAVTALPWSDAAATLERYVVVEVIVGSLAVVLAALAATAVVRRSLRPLDRVAATAQRVSELPLDRGAAEIAERVPARDTDERTEIGMVGAAVNRMLGHVESSLAARHASELKVRAFVADASHELRTPLASIRGYSELVLRRDRSGRGTDAGAVHLDDATRHAVERIASEGGRMQGLVEDLLLLARLDAGRELELAPVDLVAVVAEVVSDAHAAGPRHLWQLDLPGDGDADAGDDADDVDRDTDTDTDPDIGDLPLVLADEARLRQVLVNLTANARVHTPPGTRVRVGVAADPATREVLVSVRDDGPGIPPELADTLFDRFTRGETSRTRDADSPSSTGLGLAIAEAIVEAHGGSITVRSVPGDTCVEVRLPAA